MNDQTVEQNHFLNILLVGKNKRVYKINISCVPQILGDLILYLFLFYTMTLKNSHYIKSESFTMILESVF